jgi:hypothetical protein
MRKRGIQAFPTGGTEVRVVAEQHRSEMARRADEGGDALSSAQREGLQAQSRTTLEAQWYDAIAVAYGVAAANRLSTTIARELGKMEAQRLADALGLEPVRSADALLAVQRQLFALHGPGLIEYSMSKLDDRTCEVRIARCTTYRRVAGSETSREFACGFPARLAGWLTGLGVAHILDPEPGKCPKVLGERCCYRITLARGERAE